MILRRVLPVGFIEPCIPTLAAKPPFGPGWVHEIKHHGCATNRVGADNGARELDKLEAFLSNLAPNIMSKR